MTSSDQHVYARGHHTAHIWADTGVVERVVLHPTCFAGNEPTSIDVIITNNGNKFAKTIACNTGLSDHHYMVASALKKTCPMCQKH